MRVCAFVMVSALAGWAQFRTALSQLFTVTTGGRTLNFLKKNGLEQAIHLVGEEVHRKYVLSFEPKGGEPDTFHKIQVAGRTGPNCT